MKWFVQHNNEYILQDNVRFVRHINWKKQKNKKENF